MTKAVLLLSIVSIFGCAMDEKKQPQPVTPGNWSVQRCPPHPGACSTYTLGNLGPGCFAVGGQFQSQEEAQDAVRFIRACTR